MFKVFKNQCKNCLFSKDSVVSPERRKVLLNQIKEEESYFICHKSSLHDEDEVCCKKFYDELGKTSRKIRLCEKFKLIEFVEHTNDDRLPSYSEMNK